MSDPFLDSIMYVKNDDVSESVIQHSKRCFLDYLACVLAGSRSKQAHSCKCLGSATPMTALKYGMSAHVMELDDGHRGGAVHVGATVFSALLAVAEQENLSYKDFLYGAIIGYEATIRLACAVQPGNKLRGYHATGTCGTVGVALGIGIALHYTKEQMKTTLSAAVTSAAGVLEMQEDGSDLKPYNVGRAAMDAVVAAYIGRMGFKGPKDPLGGKRGFLKVMTDDPHAEYITDFDTKTYCIEKIYQKIYAACRHAHPAIEAALNLRNNVNIEKIDKIEVQTYRLAVDGHDHIDIQSISSAKMSIPFGVSVALVTGNAGLDAYSEKNILDPVILELTRKVVIKENEELTALCPAKRAAILIIHTNDGVYSRQVDYPKGEPENPLTQEELEEKFKELARYGGLTEEESSEVIDDVWKEEFDLKKIIRIINKCFI